MLQKKPIFEVKETYAAKRDLLLRHHAPPLPPSYVAKRPIMEAKEPYF